MAHLGTYHVVLCPPKHSRVTEKSRRDVYLRLCRPSIARRRYPPAWTLFAHLSLEYFLVRRQICRY